jgi:type IV pilus assembly protein PilV
MRLQMGAGQRGFSLVELSVAAAIYSMGLGSLSLLLLLAVHGTTGARQDTVAAMHADSLAEMIAMSSDAVGHYVYPAGAATCDPPATCPAAALAAANLAAWQELVAADLPQGAGTVCRDLTPADGNAGDAACDGSGAPVVKVFWQTPGESGPAAEDHRQVARVPLP